jgi:acyl dehydratase
MITVDMSIDDISDSPAGEIIVFKTVVSVDGKPVGVSNTYFIIRSRKKKSGVKSEKKDPDINGREIFRSSFRTAVDQQLKYAEVSGDRNFIHTNRLLARFAGLPGMIMHGVCIAAMTANCLLDEVLKGDMTRMEMISMRFANPVLPGDEITVVGYETEKADTVLFQAFNSRGKSVLKNGEYRFSV